MSTIDQRVVQMQFDNKQFEQGVSQSLSTLEKLKQALNLPDSSKGLDGLQKSLNNVDTSKLLNSIDEIGSHFTVVGRFIDRHVDQILDKMTNGVKNFIKGISVDQISAGMGKYEQYNQSVQMIQSALPEKSIEEVEAVLEKLNEYTDLTSYSFTEMANSIGKFTAAGVDLETSEIAMEGIANWAASAGGNVREANIAMYNLSQALSMGAVKVSDWKSIELANMATKEFKEHVIEAAVAAGSLQRGADGTAYYLNTTKKGVEKVTVSLDTFRETLKAGWFDANTLLTVLSEYADRESVVGKKGFAMAKVAITWTQAVDAIKDAVSTGWMKTFKYLIGDLEEAGKLFTRVSDAIIDFANGISEWRNELLKAWHEQGGYNDAVETAANIWHIFLDIVDMVRNALASVFPPVTVETLLNMTKNAREFTQSLRDIFDTLSGNKVEVEGEFPTEEAEGFFGVLKKGMQGDEVKQLQTWLEQLGYSFDNFGLDGKFGSETEKALKSFQKDSGIKEDGIFDKQSWDALQKRMLGVQETAKEILPTTPLEKFDKMLVKGDRGEGVKKLQQHLIDLGYLTDQSMADGIFGPQTQAALKKFQEDAQLEQKYPGFVANGDYGYDTWWEFKELLYDTADAAEKVHERVDVMAKVRDNMSNFIGGAVSILSNAFNVLAIGGEGALKILGALWDIVAPFVGVLVDLAGVVMGLFSKVDLSFPVLVAVGGIVSMIQNALTPIADLTNSMTSGFSNFLKKAKKFETFGEFWTGLQEELGKSNVWNGLLSALSSIGEFLAMLGPLAMAFFGTAASYIGSGLVVAFEWLATNVPIVINTISNGISKVIDYVSKSGIINTVFNGLLGVLKVIGGLFGLIAVGAMALFDAVSKAAGAVWDFLTKNKVLTKTLEKIQKFFSPVTNFFKHVRKSFTYFKNSGKKFNLDNFLDYLSRFRDDSAPITKALKAIVNGIKAIGGVALVAVAGIVGLAIAIKNGVVSLWNFITGSEKLKSVFDGIKRFFDPIITFFSALPRAIMDLNKQGKKITLANILKQMAENFGKDGNWKALEKIKTLMKNLSNLVSNLKGFYKAVKKFFIGAWESISDWYDKNLKPIVDRVKSWFRTLYDQIKPPDDVTNPIDRIRIVFANLVKLIGSKLSAATSKIRDFFTFDENLSFGENIKNKLSVIGGWFGGLGQTIKEKFVEFYNNSTYLKPAIEKLKEYGAIVKDWFENKFGSAIEWFNDHIVPIWDKITAFFTDLYDKIKAPDDVTDPIERIKMAFQNLFALIAGKFMSAWDKVKEFFTFDPNLSFVDNIQQKFGQLKDIFSTVGDTIKEKILEIYNNSPFLQKAFEKIKGFLAPLIDKLKGFIEIINQMLHGDFSGVTSLLEKIGGAFGGLWESITGKAGEIGSGLGKKLDIFGKIKDFFGKFKSLDLKSLIGPALTGIGLYSLFNFSSGIKNFAKAYKIGKVGSKSDALKKVSEALLLIVVAIGALTYIMKNNGEQAWAGIGLVLSLVGGLMGMMMAINKFGGVNAKSLSKQLLEVAGAIALLVGAITIMALLFTFGDEKAINKSIITIGVMFAGMLALLFAYNKLSSKFGAYSTGTVDGLWKMCLGILILVGAVALMAASIKYIGDTYVDRALGMIFVLLVTLGAIAIVIAKVSPSGNLDMKGFLGLAGAIAILAVVIMGVAAILAIYGDKALIAFGIVEVLLITLGAIAISLSKNSANFDDAKGTIGILITLIVGIAGLAYVMSIAIKNIEGVDPLIVGIFMGGIEAILITVGVIAGYLTGETKKMVDAVGKAGILITLFAGTAALAYVMSLALQNIQDVDVEKMKWFMGGIAVLLAIVGIIVGYLTGETQTMANAVGKAGVLITLFAGTAGLAYAMSLALQNIEGVDNEKMKIFFIGIGAILAVIGVITAKLVPLQGSIETCFGEAGILLALFVGTSLVAEAMADALTKIKDVDTDKMITFFGGVDVILGIVAGLSAYLLSLQSVDIGTALHGLLIMVLVATAIGIVAGLLSGIAGNAMDLLHTGIEKMGFALQTYNNSVGSAEETSSLFDLLKDKIVPALKDAATVNSGKLSNVASSIFTFSSDLDQFRFVASKITYNDIAKASGLLGTVGEVATDIRELGDVSDVRQAINDISGALGIYRRAVSDLKKETNGKNSAEIDSSVVNSAFDSLAKVEISDEVMNKFKGYADKGGSGLGSFATGIVNIADAIGVYSENIGGLKDKEEDIKTANEVIDKVEGINGSLKKFNFGEWLTSSIFGKKDDLNKFGEDLGALGGAVAKYVDGISQSKISRYKVNIANAAVELIAGLELPTTGSVFAFLTGEQSLGTFASNMNDLGLGVGNYINNISGKDMTNVPTSLDIIQKIADVFKNVAKTGAFWEVFTGSKSLSSLSAGLKQVGTDIANFAGELEGLTDARFKEVKGFLDDIIASNNSISKETLDKGGFNKMAQQYAEGLETLAGIPYRKIQMTEDTKFFGNNSTWTDLFSGINTLMTNLKTNFMESEVDFKPVGEKVVTEIKEGIKESSDSFKLQISILLSAMKQNGREFLKNGTFKSVGGDIVTAVIGGIKDRVDKAKTQISILLSAMKQNGREFLKNGTFASIGIDATLMIINGIKQTMEKAKTQMSILLSATKQAGRTFIQNGSFSSIGSSIVTSIANGIRANTDKTKLAISIILSAAKQTVRNWESKFYDVAAWIDHGLAQGMRDNVWRVQNAVSYIAHEAIVKFCQESAIQSPSKVFAWAGQMMDMGLVQGLVAYSSNVSDASASVADDAMNSVREGLKGYSSSLADNMDTVPTIRPVLDLSEVQNGINGINSMFGTQQIGVRSASMATAIGVKDAQIAEIKANSSEIGLAASISELNDRVNDLGERIANMRIVINGDRLVAEIVDPLDRALGRRKVRR